MKPNEYKLLDLLSNNDVTFYIPPYQRNYEWDIEQCEVFWKDILKTVDENIKGIVSEHFFGSVTYFQNTTAFGQPNKLVLIDGQQRITTTMLFLVALRNISEDENVKKFVNTKYLKNEGAVGDTEQKIKLKQVETDWIVYRNIILEDDISDNEKNSAVYRNYSYFSTKISEVVKEGIYELGDLIEKGLSKFSIITIELEPLKNKWENPQEIFESMNSLGKPLSLSDLVRNYLLLGLNPDIQSDYYCKYWMHIEKVLPNRISDFIRDYMQLKMMKSYPKATEGNYKILYSNFKEIFRGKDAEDILKDLKEYSDYYSYLVFDKSYNKKEIDIQLNDIRIINTTVLYSFLMQILYKNGKGDLSDLDLKCILDVIIIYILRRRILQLTQGENKAFPAFVKYVDDIISAPDKKKKMFEILANQDNNLRLPNDIEMTRHMSTMNFYNFKLTKYLLSLVEERLTKHRPSESDEHLQIEHIMPQHLNEDWVNELGSDYEDIHQELLHTIGNLTLIRHNQELGNKKFSEKKETYENHAGLQIARTCIIENNQWNRDAINKRASWIISYILEEIMPIPENMRKTNNFKADKSRKLSFQELQLIGLNIYFHKDPSIIARVVSDKEVEFEGKKWKLSPLTREIYQRRGEACSSGAYQGAAHWDYDGLRLVDVM